MAILIDARDALIVRFHVPVRTLKDALDTLRADLDVYEKSRSTNQKT